MTPALLTISGVCAKVGVSRWTWRKWVQAGKAPRSVPNVPGHPRWKVADVARFIDGRHGLRYFGGRSKPLHTGDSVTGERAEVDHKC